MIPKIIHYCWFGTKKIPNDQQAYINKAQELLSDYEFKLWTDEHLPMDVEYIENAFNNKKFVNLSNFMRLHVLLSHGGIYLDTDIEVLKKFDNLLHHSFFIGQEDVNENQEFIQINNAVTGAVKGHWFIKNCMESLLNTYDGTELAHLSGPVLATQEISKHIILQRNTLQRIKDIVIFPINYFHPIPWRNYQQEIKYNYLSDNTYTIHHYAESWVHFKYHFLRGKILHGFKSLDLRTLSLKETIKIPIYLIKGIVKLIKNLIKNK